MTFNIADKVTRKSSYKRIYSSKEQRQTVHYFKSETTNVKNTLSTLSSFPETSGFAKKKNVTKSELNITYVVACVGVVVSVLLILIVIQLCRMYGCAKRKSSAKKNRRLTNQTMNLQTKATYEIIKQILNFFPSTNESSVPGPSVL